MEEIKHIVDLMTDDIRSRLAERNIAIELTSAAREFVAREGFDSVYGARPPDHSRRNDRRSYHQGES